MLFSVLINRRKLPPSRIALTFMAIATCLLMSGVQPTLAQNDLDETDNIDFSPFKQARYAGSPILIHLPTDKARAIVMPEVVTLKGDPEQMPGVEMAFEGEVIGFFATRNFTRRQVIFIGVDSGTEYLFQIRASEYGIKEPLEIIR